MFKKVSKLLYVFLVTGFLLATIQGCAVLTKDQVQAVNNFAKAGKQYTDLPSTVIETHAEIMYLDNVYETAATDLASVDSVPDQLDKAIKTKKAFLAEAKQTDKTLKVIDVYISLLTKLTSDVFSEKLAKEATELSKELDSAIEAYNETVDSDQAKLSGWGKYVAAGIRGAGGIFIKIQQTKSLKNAVDHAEPQITKMSKLITKFMATYSKLLGPAAVEGLTSTYMTLITTDISKNTVESLENFALAREKAKSIKILSEKSSKAIKSFQKAHSKLYESIQKKRSIKGSISEIKSLSDEIKDAKKLIKDLEKK
jgi:uncharacterized protein YlaN (UPF0358 family)